MPFRNILVKRFPLENGKPLNTKHEKPFKKGRRLIKKKMVGRKLIKQIIPNPERVDIINFQSSSTDKIENTVTRTARRPSFLFSGRRNSNNNISQPRNGGGPNPVVETFRNPHYIDTPSSEISSYSFVPESSFVGNKQSKQQKSSATPVPKKVSRVTSRGRRKQNRTKPSHRHHFIANKGKSLQQSNSDSISKRVKLKRRKSQSSARNSAKESPSKPSSGNWAHFISNQRDQSTQTENASQLRRFNASKRSKALSQNGLTHSMEKRVRQKTGFPDLISVPATNFSCGRYTSGEYIADEETRCQVRV